MFLEKRLLHRLIPKAPSDAFRQYASEDLTDARKDALQNQVAKQYHQEGLEKYNSAWNPVDITYRATHSALARVFGRKGETLGKRLTTGAIAFGTLGFAPLIGATMDTFKPNAEGIINRTRGAIGHTWQAAKLTAKLPFSLTGNVINAGTSVLGAAANAPISASQAILGVIPGAANLLTKPLTSWVPGMEWVNQKAQNGQNAMWSRAGNRWDRTKENLSLVGHNTKDAWKDTKGTAVDYAKHLSQAGIYSASPEMVYNYSKEPIESAASSLKNGHLIPHLFTPTGKPGESWIRSDAGKKYQEKMESPFGDNNYTPTPYPTPVTPVTPFENPENSQDEEKIDALNAQMEAMQSQLAQIIQAINQGPVNNPPPQEESA